MITIGSLVRINDPEDDSTYIVLENNNGYLNMISLDFPLENSQVSEKHVHLLLDGTLRDVNDVINRTVNGFHYTLHMGGEMKPFMSIWKQEGDEIISYGKICGSQKDQDSDDYKLFHDMVTDFYKNRKVQGLHNLLSEIMKYRKMVENSNPNIIL